MSEPRLEVVHKLSELSYSPTGKVSVEESRVTVELTDDEVNIRVVLTPYQSLRVTTSDCFALSGEMYVTPLTIMEVAQSPWLAELTAALALVDESGNFMDRSRHFVIACEDRFIEVAAWDFKVEAF